jgi:hypothetical protein
MWCGKGLERIQNRQGMAAILSIRHAMPPRPDFPGPCDGAINYRRCVQDSRGGGGVEEKKRLEDVLSLQGQRWSRWAKAIDMLKVQPRNLLFTGVSKERLESA